MSDVTIIIFNNNSREALKRVVSRVLRADHPHFIELNSILDQLINSESNQISIPKKAKAALISAGEELNERDKQQIINDRIQFHNNSIMVNQSNLKQTSVQNMNDLLQILKGMMD
ncbi:hypothetical protein [Komagataeibacter oboediens]|uniref:Uncharacterized protein n=1 Tax=Komagataeibacter oboediens TaxID=65958 RepID=A0ABS5SQY4_9PROT|nr:hypothetical protein [Komagataeibacter oboediens]MBL7232074.1 hypothetical protein [Komagataeibacter oboediens]MBT0676619.1 hypothetical protein [Komagataeibacter oboediens]MBT0679944.1 hypothetical protein [Komagataeibacter oboediens]